MGKEFVAMKKLLVVMLCMLMVWSFAACGGNDASTNNNDSSQTATEANNDENVNETTDDEASDNSSQFEEITLFDTDAATMKVVGYEYDDTWGFTLKVFLENKTDKTLTFSVDEVSVNGYMIDPFWADEVAGGKKSNTEISWFEDDLKENGVETIEDIEMRVYVHDSEDWSADYLVDDVFTVNIPQ